MADAQTTIPPPPDPTDTQLQSTTGDKIGGFLGAISRPGSVLGTISSAFQQAHEKRLGKAKMYHDVMVEKLARANSPDATEDEKAQARAAYDAAKAEYFKLAPDPETKKNMQMRTALAEHHIGSQSAQGGPGAPQQPASMSPPPTPGTGFSGPEGAPAGSSSAMPPPPKPSMTDVMAGIPGEMQRSADARTIRMEQEKQRIITQGKIEEDKAKASSKKHLQHVPVTNPATGLTEPGSYDPETGEYIDQQGNVIEGAQLAAKQITYMGPGDKPLMGWAIGDTLYDQEMKPLPPGTEKFVAWMAPRTTTTEGFKTKTNPDGSTELVPVETTSTTTRGGTTGSTDSPKSKDMGEKSTSPIVGNGKPSPAKIKGAGIPFGGKVPPGVAKAYEAYNGSQERMAVMEDALPRALKGDQQAMLNLLANHVGMTVGIQKGGRITEGIYNEAAKSSPVAALFKARFDKDGNLSLNPGNYRGGVVLTPDQMRQMIDLAKTRVVQDRASWEREAAAAKQGYGMTKPPSPSLDIPEGTKGTWKGKDVIRKGGKWVMAPTR